MPRTLRMILLTESRSPAGLTEADEQVEAQYAEYLPFFEQVLEEVEREG